MYKGSKLYSFSSSNIAFVILSFSNKSSVISNIITFRVAWSLSKVDISSALYNETEKIVRIIACIKKL